jgi:hypothetical protein
MKKIRKKISEKINQATDQSIEGISGTNLDKDIIQFRQIQLMFLVHIWIGRSPNNQANNVSLDT